MSALAVNDKLKAVYAPFESKTGFVGGSQLQAAEIKELQARADFLEGDKVSQATFDNFMESAKVKIEQLDANDVKHDEEIASIHAELTEKVDPRLTSLEANKVEVKDFHAMSEKLAAKDESHDARMDGLDGDISALQSRATGVEERATLLEDRASALEVNKVDVKYHDKVVEELKKETSNLKAYVVHEDEAIRTDISKLADAVKQADHQLTADLAALSAHVEESDEKIHTDIAKLADSVKQVDDQIKTEIAAHMVKVDEKFVAVDAKDAEQDGRLDAVEARATSLEETAAALDSAKAERSELRDAVSEINAKDAEQDNKILANSNEIVALQARSTAVENRATDLEARASELESVKLNKAIYDEKMAAIDAKDLEQDARHTSAEGEIVALQGRATSLEACTADLKAVKLDKSVYDAKLAAVDAKDAAQDGRLSAVEGRASTLESRADGHDASIASLEQKKLDVATYAVDQAADAAKHAEQDGRLTAVEARASTLESVKQDKAAYDEKMAAIDAKDAEQDGRLSAVEGRASTLEKDLSTRVQAEIDSKVSQVVFDSVKAELENTDSALAAALATKVAQTVQYEIDESQNALINTKLAIEDFKRAEEGFNAKLNDHEFRIKSVEENKVSVKEFKNTVNQLFNTDYAVEHKFLAVFEFIQAMINTYDIRKPDGELYEFTGKFQGLPTAPKYFEIVDKVENGLVLSISDLLMNTKLGSIFLYHSDGSVLAQFSSNEVNDNNFTITVEQLTFDMFPLTVGYSDSRGMKVYHASITKDEYDALGAIAAEERAAIDGVMKDATMKQAASA
jgi:chromosome segregation ATPase